MMLPLLLLFFASGAAGLVYEVCWVRAFGNVFGNTVYSASLVTAVFMCGLGAGSRASGAWADRRIQREGGGGALLRAYGGAELGIGLLGLTLAFVLPRLGAFSAQVSSYTHGSHGWYALSFGSETIRYVVAILLVAPATFLMGATLTLLVRATVSKDVSQSGLRIGLLYGANTAGAALGAVAVDAFLVPRLGLAGAQRVAVALNVVVAVAALGMAGRAPDVPLAREEEEREARDGRRIFPAALALALSGFAALGMEIVWFRFLSATIGAYRPVFSLVLAVVCVGIWLGSTIGGIVQRRRALATFALTQGLFAATALAAMMFYAPEPVATYGAALRVIAAVVALPSMLMGFSFPLVNAHAQDALGVVGRRAGALYLANTAGAVLGSVVAGFVLAPWIGSQASFAVFAAAAVLAPLPMVASDAGRHARTIFGVVALVAVPLLAGWAALPAGFVAKRFLLDVPHEHVIETKEGPNELVQVVDCGGDCRALLTNGHPMSGSSIPNQRYMRAFAHVPLLMMDRPESSLVICFGVGNTVHATSLHPSLTRIDVADLSRNVLEHAGAFRASNHDVLADPRVSVYVEDGRQHLRQTPAGTYDLVTLEPPPIAFAGVSSLYSRELYELVKSRLKPNGMMTQWLPAYQVPPEVGLEMVRAFVDVFPSAVLLSGSGAELVLMGTAGNEMTFDLDRVDTALRDRPGVLSDLRRVRMGALTEIVGTFIADADALRRATAGVAAVTDDRPTMEYTFGRELEEPAALFTEAGKGAALRRFCPKCFVGEVPDPRVAWLPAYVAALARVYATPSFRKNASPFTFGGDTGPFTEALEKSAYLRSLIGAPAPAASGSVHVRATDQIPPAARAHFARGSTLARQGQLVEAAKELEAGLAMAEDNVDARYDLAVVYASLGRDEDAVREARRVLEIRRTHTNAALILCSLSGEACPR